MFESKAAVITAVLLAALLTLGLYLAPRSVTSDRFKDITPQEARLELGRAYVEGSGNPMVGIKMLQNILKQDPDNNDVRLYLSTQALNTGQFQKAMGHLYILKRKFKGEEKANVLTALGYAHQSLGNTDSALVYYRKVFEISKDSLLLQSLKIRINELTNL